MTELQEKLLTMIHSKGQCSQPMPCSNCCLYESVCVPSSKINKKITDKKYPSEGYCETRQEIAIKLYLEQGGKKTDILQAIL